MTRLSLMKASPEAFKALMVMGAFVESCDLDAKVLELVKLRISQLNSCAYCIDMHTKDARALGETEQRLHLASVWREAAHLYGEHERAALAWTEATTHLVDGQVPDAVYEEARKHFTEKQLADLTLAIALTATWNRLNVAFHVNVGSYRAGQFKELRASHDPRPAV